MAFEAEQLPAFVACGLLRRSRLGEVSSKTQDGPWLEGCWTPHVSAAGLP